MAKYYIDTKMLRDRGACTLAITEFERLFNGRMEVTTDNMRKVYQSNWLYAGWVFAKLSTAASGTKYGIPAMTLAEEFYGGCQYDHARTMRLMNRAGAMWAKVKAL